MEPKHRPMGWKVPVRWRSLPLGWSDPPFSQQSPRMGQSGCSSGPRTYLSVLVLLLLLLVLVLLIVFYCFLLGKEVFSGEGMRSGVEEG